MGDSRLHTIRDVARELGLPESTVRYYRNAFAAFLPSVGTGRRRRYPAEAIPLLRLVADGYAQNRPRAEIERALTDSLGGSGMTPATTVATRAFPGNGQRDDLLATILDGERERREVMWQMARELVRLGEAIERQQVVLARLAETVSAPRPALLSGGEGTAGGARAEEAAAQPAPPAASPPSSTPLEALTAQHELEQLRHELARERELVERLRRSKLEIERRAAEAESRLGPSGPAAPRRGLLGKLLQREDPARG
jgi:DNA-binding transcriptional MerR regulator